MEEHSEEKEVEKHEEPKKTSSSMGIVIAVIVLAIGIALFAKTGNKKAMVSDQNSMLQKNSNEESSESATEKNTEDEVNAEDTGTNSMTKETTNTTTIEVEGGMYYFKPNVIKVKKGTPVKIVFKNVEGMHNLVIDELGVKTKTIKGGNTDTVQFTPEKTGSFEFYCSIGSHRAQGMKGTITVE